MDVKEKTRESRSHAEGSRIYVMKEKAAKARNESTHLELLYANRCLDIRHVRGEIFL